MVRAWMVADPALVRVPDHSKGTSMESNFLKIAWHFSGNKKYPKSKIFKAISYPSKLKLENQDFKLNI